MTDLMTPAGEPVKLTRKDFASDQEPAGVPAAATTRTRPRRRR